MSDGPSTDPTDPTEPAELAEWLQDSPSSVGDALFLLSSVLTRRAGILEHGRFALDELADAVDEPTVPGLVATLFGSDGFHGDVENYHAEENSFLDQVIKRRLGMPITLSTLVVEVGRRLGLPLVMLGIPGHVIVGTGEDDRFIDAFGGAEVNSQWVQARLRSIFGPQARMPEGPMPEMDAAATVNRVCNNLMRSWAQDPSNKFDRLLELRTELPGSTADRALLIEVATGRGRFDLAACIREQNDPDDPEIISLWARLN